MTADRIGRRAILVAGAALVVVASAGQPARGLVCVADCDRSGKVEINELVTATRAALGLSEIALCAGADVDGSGTVTVNELIAAVRGALDGCEGAGGAAAPAAALAVARLAMHIHSLSKAFAVAFDGADRDEQCDLGGILDNTCEDSGSGFVRVDIDAQNCGDDSPEGDVTYDGPVVLTGRGGCPDVVLPYDLRFTFDWTGSTRHGDGRMTGLRWQGATLLEVFRIGQPPCSIKGATAVLDGRIEFDTSDGARTVAEPEGLRLDLEFLDFIPDVHCEPARVAATLDGTVRITDTYGSSSQVTDLTLTALRTMLSRQTRELDIAGQVEGDCFGGIARVVTAEPLGAPLGTGCFDAGRLEVGVAAGTAALRFGPGGSLDVDADGDGTFEETHTTCAERTTGACAALE